MKSVVLIAIFAALAAAKPLPSETENSTLDEILSKLNGIPVPTNMPLNASTTLFQDTDADETGEFDLEQAKDAEDLEGGFYNRYGRRRHRHRRRKHHRRRYGYELAEPDIEGDDDWDDDYESVELEGGEYDDDYDYEVAQVPQTEGDYDEDEYESAQVQVEGESPPPSYFIVKKWVEFEEAKKICKTLKAHIPVIENIPELRELIRFLIKKDVKEFFIFWHKKKAFVKITIIKIGKKIIIKFVIIKKNIHKYKAICVCQPGLWPKKLEAAQASDEASNTLVEDKKKKKKKHYKKYHKVKKHHRKYYDDEAAPRQFVQMPAENEGGYRKYYKNYYDDDYYYDD